MRRTFVGSTLVLVMLGTIAFAPSAHADLVPVGVDIKQADGAMTLPSTCKIKNSGGGCGSAQAGFTITSGLAYSTVCTSVVRYTTTQGGEGPCTIDDGDLPPANGAGTGSVTVSSSNCTSFTLDLATGSPYDIDFTDGTATRWNLATSGTNPALRIIASNGRATPTGWIWTVSSATMTAKKQQDPSLVLVESLTGDVTASVNCTTQDVSDLHFTLAGTGRVDRV